MTDFQAPCGCDCGPCEHRPGKCQGCLATAGKPFWAIELKMEQCPFYACVINDKKLAHCGQCPELPCKMHTDFRDPSISEEQCALWLKERLANLARRNELEKKG